MTAPSGRLHAAAPEPPPAVLSRSRPRRLIVHLSAAVFTLLVAVPALPDLLFGLDRHSPFAQLAAFRPWIMVGVLALLGSLLLVLWFERRVWPFAVGVLAVLLVGAVMVLPRAVAGSLPVGGTPLTVLEFNTYEGRASVAELADLIRTQRPDVVAVVEAGDGFRSRLAPLVEPLGYRLYTSTDPEHPDVGGVTAAVAAGLGDVQVRLGADTASFPYLEVTGGRLGELRFVAFHATAPMPGAVAPWQADLALLQNWCAGPTPAVVAGDLNATLDHSALRSGMAGCTDAAAQRGAGLVPTWGPTAGLRAVGPQIDHVLVTAGIGAETFAVHDVAGSDHRAVVTRLRLPA